jgi:carbamoyltransferase
MKFIGLRLDDHDTNITYTDGVNVKYTNCERNTQKKHHGYNDLNSWIQIIKKWGINPSEVDAIAIIMDKFLHINVEYEEEKLFNQIELKIFKVLGFDCPVYRVDHHYCHALSVWPLGVKPTVSIVSDGFGDDKINFSVFRDDKIVIRFKEGTPRNGYVPFESVAMSLSAVGDALNIDGDPLDHAGKIMGLVAYGANYNYDKKMFNLENLSKAWMAFTWDSLKLKENKDFPTICDWVTKAHSVTEKVYVDAFEKYTNLDDVISYSGGVAQNTVINTRIRKVRPDLHIPPHCNDSGLSLGAVEFLRKYYDQEDFDTSGFPFWEDDQAPSDLPSKKTIKETAERLARGEIVAWYQGHGEVGPRALGNRSILMNPSIKNGKVIINGKVKNREHFRPFGASVLEGKANNYFDFPHASPYMLYVMDMIDDELYPPVTHLDGTCRAQTVSQDLEVYYSLIEEFELLTGIPMLLNTSLNVGGKPIAAYKENALDLWCNTDLDTLVFGDEVFSDD